MAALVVVAPDSFKGTLDAAQAARAMGEALREVFPDALVREVPVADGGEGTVEALRLARGGEVRRRRVTGPLGEPVDASYLVLDDGTAVVEMAQASGLTLVPEALRDPRKTTSAGTGELVRDALEHGARRILVGLGGSATNDAGMGAMRALGVRFLDESGEELAGRGQDLGLVRSIDASGLDALLDGAEAIALADVDAPLCGPRGATRVFAPQKGADAPCVEGLEHGMCSYAQVLDSWAAARRLPAPSDVPGSGAAGGMGSALVAFLGARVRSGIDLILDVAGIDGLLAGASLCVTGEGRLDAQTLGGKAVAGVSARCARAGVPCVAVAGVVDSGLDARAAGLSAAIGCLSPREAAEITGDELARGAHDRIVDAIRANAPLLRLLSGGGAP